MSEQIGNEMYSWLKDLFPLNRSLTGQGVRDTLQYLKQLLPELTIHSVPTGTKCFDWQIPKEWEISDAHISDLNGNRIIDWKKNNLHVVGYSQPIDKVVSRQELEKYLFSLPELPDAIPYVTSYYDEKSAFCLSENQKKFLNESSYHIKIESKLFDGELNFGELLIPGETDEEVLFSTYVCHPSMANNELSGPVVATALAKHICSLEKRRYSYRILFNIETIGSVYYISRNLPHLKAKLAAGWVMTCLGDNKNYSFVPSRSGNTYSDKISLQVIYETTSEPSIFTWFDRGSDERQFCSPGVDLPVSSLMRSKYHTYAEYHTSLDNLDFVSPSGLLGGLEMYMKVVKILETNQTVSINTMCEPQLSKRNLYPTTSTKDSNKTMRNFMNVISLLDGESDLLEISIRTGINYDEILEITKQLIRENLVVVENYELSDITSIESQK